MILPEACRAVACTVPTAYFLRSMVWTIQPEGSRTNSWQVTGRPHLPEKPKSWERDEQPKLDAAFNTMPISDIPARSVIKWSGP